MAYQKHLHMPANQHGHDYIVGDLHGELDKLTQLLTYINFDPTKDRLFSVGDIIDRGPQSVECAELIYEPWFYMTMGNHELLMIQSILAQNQAYLDVWNGNGGKWHHDVASSLLEEFAFLFAHQPLVISVGDDDNRYNIVHAEFVKYNHYHDLIPITNADIDNWNFSLAHEDDMLWGRTIVESHWHFQSQSPRFCKDQFHSNELSTTYVGHSAAPKARPTQIQKHVYLDTGAAMGYNLTIASPTKKLLYILNNKKHISVMDYNSIQKINIPE